ncbi:hypothetical protein HIM_03967 [Hirsutella minnesotensis 3608]|uniref:Uncharacterized protein n=1 Tax=Hirsutella minnesotensis 3608 TaxID=1043627 RepID=A0A0F7ZLR3_9HYPO|nr:hypothetical protein HIM_03967 [Hirsutella minnesotensis 3608]
MRRSSALASVAILLVVFFLLATQLQSLRDFATPPLNVESWRPVANFSDVPGFAKQVSAADVLARPPTVNATTIPRLFHQSWKSLSLPAKFEKWSNTCRKQHEGWEWVIWTDEDNLALVRKHFPWLETLYHDLPGEIYRADLARYLYMYIYGGVYADLDTDCLRPTEDLQDSYDVLFDDNGPKPAKDTAIFGRMGIDPSFAHSIPNAWMASTPGHPFFLSFLQSLTENVKKLKRKWGKMPEAEHVTGPAALREAIIRYESDKVRFGYGLGEQVSDMVRKGPFAKAAIREHQVLLLPNHFIYPYSWGSDGINVRQTCWVLSKTFDAEKCKAAVEVERMKSISITYWSHTHTPSGHDNANMKHLEADA